MTANWYARAHGVMRGPYTWSQLQDLADKGQLPPGTEVRRTDLPAWLAASAVPGLFSTAHAAVARPDATEGTTSGPASAGHPVAYGPIRPRLPRLGPAPVWAPANGSGGYGHPTNGSDGINGMMVAGIVGGAVLLIALLLAVAVFVRVLTSGEGRLIAGQPAVSVTDPVDEPSMPPLSTAAIVATSTPPVPPRATALSVSEESLGSVVEGALASAGEPTSVEGMFEEDQDPAAEAALSTEELQARSESSVAVVGGTRSFGSGFLAGRDLVVTSRRAIAEDPSDRLEVRFPSAAEGKQGPYRVRLLWEHPEYDLAFVEVRTSLPPLPIAVDHQFSRGEEIVFLGNVSSSTPTTNRAVGGDARASLGHGLISSRVIVAGHQFDQVLMPVQPSHSGGPLLDRTGAVVGVISREVAGPVAMAYATGQEDLVSALAGLRRRSPAQITLAATLHDVERLGRDARLAALVLIHVAVKANNLEIGESRRILDDAEDQIREVIGDDRTAGDAPSGLAPDHRAVPGVGGVLGQVRRASPFDRHWVDRSADDKFVRFRTDLIDSLRNECDAIRRRGELPADVAAAIEAMIQFTERVYRSPRTLADPEGVQEILADYQTVTTALDDCLAKHRSPEPTPDPGGETFDGEPAGGF